MKGFRIYVSEEFCAKLNLQYYGGKGREVYIDCLDLLYFNKNNGYDQKHRDYFAGLITSGVTRVKYANNGYGWFVRV